MFECYYGNGDEQPELIKLLKTETLPHISPILNIVDLSEQSCLNVFTAAMTVSTQAILMSVKNVMLCETAMGLLLSTLRVLANTYFVTPTHRGLG